MTKTPQQLIQEHQVFITKYRRLRADSIDKGFVAKMTLMIEAEYNAIAQIRKQHQNTDTMILPFKQQFVEPINNGTKIHTLRDDIKERWQEGMKIHMVINLRQPTQETFNDKHTCTGIQKVKFTYGSEGFKVSIDDKELTMEQLNLLAKNDGFISLRGFKDWFIPLIEKNGGSLTQRLIHWTDFRY